MKSHEKAVFDLLREISKCADVKTKRSFTDFYADRIVQACTEPNLMSAVERLAKTVNVRISELYKPAFSDFMANHNKAEHVLPWIRKYPTATAMLCSLKKDDYLTAIEDFNLEEIKI